MAKEANQQSAELAKPPDDLEPEHVEVTALEATAIEVMERAAIDVQIATAKRYPRSQTAFLQRAHDMVSLDEETAMSCIYRRPVGRDGRGNQEYAEGESIRLAEIVAASYGNIRVKAMITEITPRHVKAVGFAHDLETNYAAQAEVLEATVTRNGQPYSERMRVVVAKAGQSKAMRDAIFRVVPKSLCKSLTALAREVAFGKGESLTQRRERLLAWIKQLGIETPRVFAALGLAGVNDIGEEQLVTLTGLRTAIKDGDITVEEAFPPLSENATKPGLAGLQARIAEKREAQANGSKTPPPEVPDLEFAARREEQQEKLQQAEVQDQAKQSKQSKSTNGGQKTKSNLFD